MLTVPSNFISLCQIAGIEKGVASKKWLELVKSSVSSFLNWLVTKENLSEEELERLNASANEILSSSDGQKN